MGSQVHKMRRNCSFKWETGQMKYLVGSQANQDEVPDNCCHVTFALKTFRFKGHFITFSFYFNNLYINSHSLQYYLKVFNHHLIFFLIIILNITFNFFYYKILSIPFFFFLILLLYLNYYLQLLYNEIFELIYIQILMVHNIYPH